MTYSLSQFNFYTHDSDNNMYIYNFLTGLLSMTKVDARDIPLYDEIITRALSGKDCDEKYKNAMNWLKKQGILIPTEIHGIEMNQVFFYEQALDTSLDLVILPTFRCNFKCSYCFEHSKKLMINSMDRERQNALYSFVQKNIRGKKELRVVWFGGEPLLEVENIIYLSEKFISLCKRFFLPYSAEIITNGYFLSPDVFDRLYSMKIYSYTVTLDGFGELHDKQRVTASGQGSFNTIITNLLAIRDNQRYKYAHVCIRINMSKEFVERMDEFIHYLYVEFSSDSRFFFQFAPIRNYSLDGCDVHDIYPDENALLRALNENREYHVLSGDADIIGLLTAERKCIASRKNTYTVSPELDVYKCYVYYDFPNNKVGHIGLDGEVTMNEFIHREWYSHNNYFNISQECLNCFYLPCCSQGGKICPVKRLNMDLNSNDFCPQKNKKHMGILKDSVLYAANKYECHLLDLKSVCTQ